MSMLAEKKRKQKWSLNPRGNDWVQDSNKFGQKILEKMGWQNGKGLGAKEDGITEHIKVSYKNDSKGMGFKESNDQWTEHETNFSALLESLSGEKPEETKVNSLEKKSQNSRARVHYHKFTRGKDLSRYSEKDLANIFGKKTLKETSKVKEEKTDSNDDKSESDSKFLFNAGSMRDYFKKKLPGFGKTNGYVIGHNGVLKKEESDSETDARPSFSCSIVEKDEEEVSYSGFGFKSEVMCDNNDGSKENSQVTFVSYINGTDNGQIKEKKSKKKRKGEENDVENVLSPKKKLRKSKEDISKNSELDSEKGISNPAFNPLQTPVKVEKHILETIEESVISDDLSDPEDCVLQSVVTTAQVHKPKRKEKHLEGKTEIHIEVDDGTNVKVKKQSKKTRIENGIANSTFAEEYVDLTLNVSKESESEISPYEVKRKEVKKKKKEKNSEQIVEDVIQIEGSDCETKTKKTKKKKLENKIEENIVVDLTNDISKERQIANDTENNVTKNTENSDDIEIKKSKKKTKENDSKMKNENSNEDETVSKINPKKKKKTFALENPSFEDVLEESVISTPVEENPYEIKTKKKKKATKSGIENLNFNESAESSTPFSTEQNPYEVKITEKNKKKKKKKEDYAIENPNFDEKSLEETLCEVKDNPYEVKPKKKKKKKETLAIDNPNFNANDSVDSDSISSKDKNNDNSSLSTLDASSSEIISLNINDGDLMLNVVSTPILTKPPPTNNENIYSVSKVNSVKRRKSVRFSDVTQERIIPNNDDLRNLTDMENRKELFEINTQVITKGLQQQDISFDMSALDRVAYDDKSEKRRKKKILGTDNAAFDKHKTNLEENVESISKTIDMYEAEIENDINEKKLETLTMDDVMVGEVGNPHGEHEKLPEGTKLKFKYANFTSRTPLYHLDKTGARKSYKHLIKGDIFVEFKNTNLHEIHGYAAKKKIAEV